jgi:uncharacterized protein DUF5565
VRKIPTLFRRDPDQPALITRDVHPDCQWVLDGEGLATRKFDGSCVGFFAVENGAPLVHGGRHSGDGGVWLARREVKPGKPAPAGFIAEQSDPATSKTVGWEPIEQSSFVKLFNEAVPRLGAYPYYGTYELCGPRINGNPENFALHTLVRHESAERLKGVPLDFDGLIAWLLRQTCEGVVWHGPDGLMAKLKVRDARAYVDAHREADAS